MLRCDPAAKRAVDLMDFPQFSGRERRNAILGHENAQLILGVDAPLRCASVYECAAGVVVLAEEDRLAKGFTKHHHETQPKQRQERRLVLPERICEIWRATAARLHM